MSVDLDELKHTLEAMCGIDATVYVQGVKVSQIQGLTPSSTVDGGTISVPGQSEMRATVELVICPIICPTYSDDETDSNTKSKNVNEMYDRAMKYLENK